MGEINVTAKTQQIVVDPFSSAVSIINAGPQGPQGVQGPAGVVDSEALSLSEPFVSRYLSSATSLPTNAIAATFPRNISAATNQGALTSGTLLLTRITLPPGPINSISYVSGTTAAGTPTNQWFALYDSALNKLAVTANDTTTAWGTHAVKTLAISGGYTVPSSGDFYLGILVTATTVPSLRGMTHGHLTLVNIPPVLTGTSNTGLTTPATAPAIATTITGTVNQPYAFVS